MRKPGLVLPADLQRQIRSSATDFAGEIIVIVQRAIMGEALSYLGTSAAPKAAKRPGRPPSAAKKAAPAAKKAAPAAKVSGDLVGKLVALLKQNKDGLGAEKINAALGTTSKDLVKPLQQLMAEGRVKRFGQARGTRYQAA
jgi:hypothetical protein